MTKLCFQYLAIFGNENAPNITQIVPKWVENFAQKQITLNILPKIYNYLPKWWNFAKSGHPAGKPKLGNPESEILPNIEIVRSPKKQKSGSKLLHLITFQVKFHQLISKLKI